MFGEHFAPPSATLSSTVVPMADNSAVANNNNGTTNATANNAGSSTTTTGITNNSNGNNNAIPLGESPPNRANTPSTPFDKLSLHSPNTRTFQVGGTTYSLPARYELIKIIGHGAYGVVISCSDVLTGESVAVKKIAKAFENLVDAK